MIKFNQVKIFKHSTDKISKKYMDSIKDLDSLLKKIKTRAGRGDTRAFLFHVARVVGQSYVRQHIVGTI